MEPRCPGTRSLWDGLRPAPTRMLQVRPLEYALTAFLHTPPPCPEILYAEPGITAPARCGVSGGCSRGQSITRGLVVEVEWCLTPLNPQPGAPGSSSGMVLARGEEPKGLLPHLEFLPQLIKLSRQQEHHASQSQLQQLLRS